MAVKEFELFHGAVLTKLVRSDRPLTLRMIETRAADAWSTYRINDEVRLLVKHSLIGRAQAAATAWQFVFSPDQMRQVAEPDTWSALVCASRKVGDPHMEVCLLDPGQITELLDLASMKQQSLTVKRLEGKGLRVSSARHDELIVSRNRLDKWDVPGS